MTEQNLILGKEELLTIEHLDVGDWFLLEGWLYKFIEKNFKDRDEFYYEDKEVESIVVFSLSDGFDEIHCHRFQEPIVKVGKITIIAEQFQKEEQEKYCYYAKVDKI